MTKAVVIVAKLRQCDEPTARAFCEAVQRCFRGSLPPFQLIAQQLKQLPTSTPQQLAESISPTLIYRKVRGLRGFDENMDMLKLNMPVQGRGISQKNPLRSLNRLDPNKAATCPHGIPFYRKCAICHKEEFQELTGL